MGATLRVETAEYNSRLQRLQAAMQASSIDVFVISDRANFEYFSGYRSLFWASNARPFFLIVPSRGQGAFVVCSASEARAFAQTTVVPAGMVHKAYSGFMPECIRAIAEVIADYKPGRIAFDYGFEFFGMGSLKLVDALREAFPRAELTEGSDYIWPIRSIKSVTEIRQKKLALDVATTSFTECLAKLSLGATEIEFARALTIRFIEKGATSVPWLPVRFGKGAEFAYSLPPTDRKLAQDDFIWVDIGCVVAESLSDINRIAKAGLVSAEEQSMYSEVREMTVATLAAMKPGMTGREAYKNFEDLARQSKIGLPSVTASRIGHGSGTNLTEPPSIGPTSDEVLKPGMIIHVEPKYERNGGVFQLEEVAVITESGAEIISSVAPAEFPVIGG